MGKAASAYGVPQHMMFQPDDLAMMGHLHKVTRTLFAFAEPTNMDLQYEGPAFNFDKILKELLEQGIRRKSSAKDVKNVQTGSINSIFANLMQDVERKNSTAPRTPL